MMHDPYHRHHRHTHRTIPVECVHRIEVEVYPSSGQVYFADERFVDPACTQLRFDATVFNATSGCVEWLISAEDGGSAAGTIDQHGLYRAPAFPSLPATDTLICFTEVITARSVEDPARMARAFVTVSGKGPLPPPVPAIRISPRRCTIYREGYAQNRENNQFIDRANYQQSFIAERFYSSDPIVWKVNGAVQTLDMGADSRKFNFKATASLTPGIYRARAELSTNSAIYDEVEFLVTDYTWGGLWTVSDTIPTPPEEI